MKGHRRSQWWHGGSKWSPGGFVSQIHITFDEEKDPDSEW